MYSPGANCGRTFLVEALSPPRYDTSRRPLKGLVIDLRTDIAYQECINIDCGARFGVEQPLFECPKCGDLLDARYDWSKAVLPRKLADFEAKWARQADPLCFSGVWRFHELLPFAAREHVVTVGEGRTILQRASRIVEVEQSCVPFRFRRR